MKNTIWFFGDSFTAGDGCIKDRPIDGQYLKEYPKGILWTQGVADHFRMNIKNMSTGGASNDWIINSLINELPNIQPNDIVVFQLSFPERFQLIDKYDKNYTNFIPTDFVELDNPNNITLDKDDKKYNQELYEALRVYLIEYRIQHHDILIDYQRNQAQKLLKKIEESGVQTLLWDISNRPSLETIDDVIGNGDKHWSWGGHKTWMNICISLLENDVVEYKPYPHPKGSSVKIV